MENFKFALFSIVVLILLTFVGYWGFSSIESGSSHTENQKLIELTQENKNLAEKNSGLLNEITALESKMNEQKQITLKEKAIIKKRELVKSSVSQNQKLISSLQKLVTDNISMKKGSLGTRVGTVQKFLNVYNKTSNRIDNDFGKKMEVSVKNFQKGQKLTADGVAGSNTFRKMIDWLKKQ